jgi:alkylresorcinol/alkylpyrone synthase
MGWTFDSQGLRLVLAQGIPAFVKEALRPALEAFLSDLGLALGDVSFWALHPGGRRVIEAYLDALGLEEAQLEWTRRSLRSRGNLSSASVLATLADIIESGRPRAGDRALVLGLGPGFAAELVMLEW